MIKPWAGISIGVAIIVAIVLLQFGSCGTSNPKIPVTVQKDLDSLKDTRPVYDSLMSVLRARVVRDSIARVHAQQRASRDSATAASAEQRADSIAANAVSAEQWHVAYDTEHTAMLHWKLVAFDKDTALQHELAGHLTTKLQLDSARKRVDHLEHVTIPDLEKTIAGLEKPCRVVGSIPCPSRKVVGAVFALAGALAHR